MRPLSREGKVMQVGAIATILDELSQGADPAASAIALSRAQAELSARLLVQMFALKASTEMQEAAALALLQSAMGVGQNIDHLA